MCSPMSNSTCSHFCPQPLQKGLDAAQCQSWLILWFPARPFLVLQMFLPETAASFPPLTILSSCLPAEASKQVLPMQPPLRPSSALGTHTRQDPSPRPVVHISCATSHSSLEAIPSSSAHCMFSCPCAACMLPVISKETG